jgi:hypothetical protein
MLKPAEKNVLFTIFATALIGLTGMRTSFSGEATKQVRQSMEETCELINGKMECIDKSSNIVKGTVE